MSYLDERRAFEVRFSTQWGATTLIRWEGVPFKMPDPSIAWVALYVRPGAANRITIGPNPRVRVNGRVIVQVFTPEATSLSVTYGYADTIADIFREAEFSYGNSGLIRCRQPEVAVIGMDSGWLQKNVVCPYIRDKQL